VVDNLAVNFFMQPTIRKPIAKNSVINSATLIIKIFSPYGVGECMTESLSHIRGKIAIRKGIAIRKKSWAFIFHRYCLSWLKIFAFRTLTYRTIFYVQHCFLRNYGKKERGE